MGVIISGHGNYLPNNKICNKSLIETYKINSSDKWIQKKLGIYSRNWAPKGENTSDLAFNAAQNSLLDAHVKSDSLSKIILGTSTSDHTNLSSACRVQFLLKSSAVAYDIVSACASFIFALQSAIDSVQLGAENVLCIGADVKSRFVNKSDRKFLPIFGDGAGALLLNKSNLNEGFLSIHLWTNGQYFHDLYNPAGGSAMPASYETVANDLHVTTMKADGYFITTLASDLMAEIAKTACDKAKIDIKDVDYFIPHHANFNIMKLVANNLNIDSSKIFSTIHYTGNMVAASLPFALSELLKRNINPGSLILLVSLGAGASGGATVYRTPTKTDND